MQRGSEQRSGALGFKLQTDGLHGMSPRSVQGFVQHQQRLQQPVTDLLSSKRSANPAKPATTANDSRASPSRQAAVTFAHAASAGVSANTSPERSRRQSAANSGWLPKLPLAAASAPAAAATAAAAGVQHLSPGGSRTPRMSPRGHAEWHVPYKFSTPLEKQLQKQLEVCKRDPAERAALEARVKTYEDADQPAREAREALLAANKAQAVALTADVRIQALQQEAMARQERSKQVQQQHQQREQEQLAAKLAAVQRSENIKRRRLQEEAEREAHNLQIFQSKHWSGIVASTLCIKELLTTVRQMQRFEEISSQQEAAVVTIQSCWRGYLARKDYRRSQQAVRKLQAAFRSHLSKDTDRSSRQRLAVQCVLRFLIELHGQSHLKLAVKHVQRAVLRDMRLSKQLNLLRTAQHILLTNQWIAMEAKMLALARKRAGADVTLAPGKSIKQAKSGLAAQLASRQKGTAVTADRRKPADEAVPGQTSSGSSSSGPAGPSPSCCHVTDRPLLEELEPTPLRLKGLLAQVFIKLKAEHYIRVIGLHWKDKAAYKRKHRAEINLAAARSILHGGSAHAEPAAAQGSRSNSTTMQPNELCVQPSSTAVAPAGLDACGLVCPTLVPFRATATLKELDVLMQQAAAEAPYYEAVLARQNLDEYMANLEQQLAARKQGSGSNASIAARQQQQQQKGASSDSGDSARETLQRMEACLTRRFVLANINLTDGLTKLPATCHADWDDVTLSNLIYKS